MINLFLKTDEMGNITESLALAEGIPTQEYFFMFQVEDEVAAQTHNYKVVLNGFKPELVLIEQTQEEDIETIPEDSTTDEEVESPTQDAETDTADIPETTESEVLE
ncbi:hypothetical protein M3690_04295 [Priestia megaterium]|uniref:hypothetical protein n=1 Tax=Priestia megaterium TaxID=1404 RepID=UPI00203ECD6C|nr:hypothetical protein [Priestia megaterium]MCM3792512.1 hypothetical protein [Priestia megaterium]